MASIANDDSVFIFAVDNARVEPDASTGRLRLIVDLAVKGDDSAINRFGFQVVVIAGVRATGIAGRVLWDKSLLDASNLTSEQLKTVVFIHANILGTRVVAPGAYTSPELQRIADTIPQSIHRDGNDFWVPYAFDHLPLNTPLCVTVDPSSGFPSQATAGQINGPLTIVLTQSHLSEAGVDFRITPAGVVR